MVGWRQCWKWLGMAALPIGSAGLLQAASSMFRHWRGGRDRQGGGRLGIGISGDWVGKGWGQSSLAGWG